MRVLSLGTGQPAVLFDSALGTPAEEWDLVAGEVARFAKVILWDRPGVGRSNGPALGPDEYPAAAADLLAQLETGPVVAVGHSIGGLNVLCLALAYPQLVAGVVLVDPSHPEQDQRMAASGGPSAWLEDRLIRLSNRMGQPPSWITGPLGAGLALAGRAAAPALGRLSRDGGGSLRTNPAGVRLLAEMAPVVAANVWSFTAEADIYTRQLAAARDLMASKSFPPVPLKVLTGRRTQGRDPERTRLWDDMHESLARLSPLGEHIRLDCGHAIPFTNPTDVAAAISGVWQAATDRSAH